MVSACRTMGLFSSNLAMTLFRLSKQSSPLYRRLGSCRGTFFISFVWDCSWHHFVSTLVFACHISHMLHCLFFYSFYVKAVLRFVFPVCASINFSYVESCQGFILSPSLSLQDLEVYH